MDDSSSSDGTGEFNYKNFRPKKKRRSDAGRRYQRGVLYDSSLGITCHFCRQKTTVKHVFCRACALALCGPCLRNRHGEDLVIERADDNWLCPRCRGGCGPGCNNCCNCTFCRKKQGLKPPKISAGELRANGFNNVHDYLIHLETGESADRISARKSGKGWCSSYDKRHLESEQDTQISKQKKRGTSNECLDETTTSAASMYQKGLDAEYYEKPMRKSDENVNAVESERPLPSRVGNTHQIINDEKNTERPMSEVAENVTHTGSKSQISKAEESFPKQFRLKNEFMEKLKTKLAVPFDAQELKDLWNGITCRKPVCKNSETHIGTSCFSAKELGHSYIDHYQDLAAKYTATGEPEVKLKLLRGFFFWLEHASMSGSFKPWKDNDLDEECLELKGPDCQVLGVLLNVDKEQETPNTLQDGDNEEDIKPGIKKGFEESSSSKSKTVYNWDEEDEEDIKPKVEELADWRRSTQVHAGRA